MTVKAFLKETFIDRFGMFLVILVLWTSVCVIFALLTGCNALGGIPPETVGAVANAGGGCVKVSGVWGSGIIVVGSADKGVIRNGEVTVAGDCGGVTIKEAPKPVSR